MTKRIREGHYLEEILRDYYKNEKDNMVAIGQEGSVPWHGTNNSTPSFKFELQEVPKYPGL